MSAALLASFRDFFETSLAQWSPGAKYAVLKILDGGRTSASVSVVDIVSTKAQALSGQFVLKIQSKADLWDEEIEYERHTSALNWSPTFGDKHIPKLVHHAEDDKYIAILYEIAGHSLSAVVTADSVEAGSLQRYGRLVSRTLLTDLNTQYTVDLEASAKSMLESWLGYRLDPGQAASLHSFVEEELATDGVAILAGRILANPLWFCKSEAARGTDGVQFSGLIHGDLHPGNIMVDRQSSPAESFWLIDFALSRRAPLFYDHAYLELALLLNNLEGLGRERMIGVLDALDSGTNEGTAKVPVADVGLVQCLASIRTGADEWQASYETQRLDAYNAQQHLARIAAALNWTNKPIAIANKRLALAYGCWYTMRYLKSFCPSDWNALLQRAEHGHQLLRSRDTGTIENVFDLPLSWPALWSDCSRFDETTTAYVLITGAFDRTQDDPAALGLLPWAAIIDLDPNSDEGGLMSTAGATLGTLRSTHRYGKTPLPLALDRGTAWLMAGGWPSHLEQIPQSLSEWRRTYIRCIRDLFITLRETTIPKPVTVIVLPGPGLEQDRISRILEIVDEELADSGNILLIGDRAEDNSSLHVTHHAMTPSAFAFCVQTVFGAQAQTAEPTIPSATGLVSIPIDRLRNWEEDLDVLHSRILVDLPGTAHSDEFWRGSPPTWTDLHAGADIPRSIQTKLVGTLEDLLAQGRNRTLELHHLPGAGGTTTALRAIYSLRNSYPCAVLRRVSKLTVDRLDQMFQLTQKPVLLLAESADLSPAAREELYRDLASRNSRAVLLYVVRTISVDEGRELSLSYPMEKEEAAQFATEFSKRTSDYKKRERLARVAHSTDARYVCPFFFGLTLYAHDFTSIDRYVHIYLEDTPYGAQKLLRYVAMVTRFSQVGIDEALLRRMVGIQPTSLVGAEEMLGGQARQLVLKVGQQLRVLHPAIAEEMLKQLLGGSDDWRDGLKDLATDFIRECVSLLGSESRYLDKLFTHLFIRRDEWAAPGLRSNFAELIRAIPSKAGQHQLFQLLTELCPNQPHYWNHLGRHHIYEMKHDYSTADTYLRRAVDLAPRDSFHHHSLGMVLRFWVRDQLRDMLRRSEAAPQPVEMFLQIRDLAGRASECFVQTRELQPEDNHGYITHIQMILEIAERLMLASGGNSLQDFGNQQDELSKWIRSNVVVAEDLLSRVAHMRADAGPSRFEVKCGTRLKNLFGDFVAAIKLWEGMLTRPGAEQPTIRRAVASAYFCKAGRIWNHLDVNELVRTCELMEQNLHEDPTNDRDVQTWFQAYRRLSDFSYLQALDRLEAWAARADSLEAHYYCYVLHFLLWREGVSRTEEQIISHLDRCVELAVGRRGHSYEWLATEPVWCPLVHHTELGGFNRQKGFYNDSSKLDRVEGVIESMKGPQAGLIRVGQATRAFFVPGTEFWESQHLNAIVNFHLGFAYGGLRAWRLSPGRIVATHVAASQKKGQDPPTRDQHVPERQPADIKKLSRGTRPRLDPVATTILKAPMPAAPRERVASSIYVGNIPFGATEQELSKLFSRFGVVAKVSIPVSPGSNQVRGYAFVDFVAPESAVAALGSRAELVLHGRTLHVGPSKRTP